MSTGSWSELSAEHEVSYIENGNSFTITDVQDIWSSVGAVWVGVGGVRSKDQTGVLVGLIT